MGYQNKYCKYNYTSTNYKRTKSNQKRKNPNWMEHDPNQKRILYADCLSCLLTSLDQHRKIASCQNRRHSTPTKPGHKQYLPLPHPALHQKQICSILKERMNRMDHQQPRPHPRRDYKENRPNEHLPKHITF
jgi:hypothetical protein